MAEIQKIEEGMTGQQVADLLDSNFKVLEEKIGSGGGESITVDGSLSDSSTNPVQNKVIKAELDKKAEKSDIPSMPSLEDYATTQSVNTAIDAAKEELSSEIEGNSSDISNLQSSVGTLATKVSALSGIDSPFVGYFDAESKLPAQDSPAWALVGDLATAKPYAYYVTGNVPTGYSAGWNDLSSVLGTYDFTSLSDYVKEKELFKDDIKNADFCIADEADNILALFKNGHVKTKNFDSRKTTSVENDDSDSELNISDEKGNIISLFSKGHVKTKNFDSRKKIKILFIGNSVSQDHVTYLPYIIRNTYGNNIDFSIYIYYIGGYTLKEYVENVITGAKGSDIFSYAKNSEKWTNDTSGVKLNDALKKEHWDIISIQGYYNYFKEDMTKVPALVKYIKDNTESPFELAWLMHQTYKGDEVSSAIVAGAKTAIKDNPVSFLFSPFYATEYAKEVISQSILTGDGTHNQEGLPCMLGAYHILTILMRFMGIPNKVIGNRLRMTSSTFNTLNIPGANGSVNESLTEDDYYNLQCAAIKAVNAADGLYMSAKIEMEL